MNLSKLYLLVVSFISLFATPALATLDATPPADWDLNYTQAAMPRGEGICKRRVKSEAVGG